MFPLFYEGGNDSMIYSLESVPYYTDFQCGKSKYLMIQSVLDKISTYHALGDIFQQVTLQNPTKLQIWPHL